MSVENVIVISTENWKGTTGVAGSESYAARAYDRNNSTRWDTKTAQVPGQIYQLDMGRMEKINRIIVDTSGSSGDYMVSYELYLSDDGLQWGSFVASGKGAVITTITFPETETRFIKIVQTGKKGNYWSIHELRVERVTMENLNIVPVNSANWIVGLKNDNSAEFKSPNVIYEEKVIVPNDCFSVSDWSLISSGMNRLLNPFVSFKFNVDNIPEFGVELSVRIIDAYKSVPQLSIYLNESLTGIFQIVGFSGATTEFKCQKTYKLYIPKEFFIEGENILLFEIGGSLYSTEAEYQYQWLNWDYIEMRELNDYPLEPTHGNYVSLGTCINNRQFYYDEGALAHLENAAKWLGIAYSGNILRAGAPSDVNGSDSHIFQYYEKMKELNLGALVLQLHTGSITLNSDGTLPKAAIDKVTNYLKKYGSLIHYYEVDNEPGLFNRSKAVNIAIAKWLNEEGKKIVPHLKVVSPGWAYSATKGDPIGWERDPKQRKEIEDLTEFTNGHAYGASYVDNLGGSFIENSRTVGLSSECLNKKMFASEFGTADSHTDGYKTTQPNAAAFDRITRAHVGFVDIFMQHAAFFKGYSLFEVPSDYNISQIDPMDNKVFVINEAQDSRVKIFRRMALAYATHGKPLSYTILNKNELNKKKVYVRTVDTSSLKPLFGSNAVSNKILVNIVNFEPSTQNIKVKVDFSVKGKYKVERIGKGNVFKDAWSQIDELTIDSYMDIDETLEAGESVQYILEFKEPLISFSKGINFSGDNVIIDQNLWLGENQSNVSISDIPIRNCSSLIPSTNQNVEYMLSSSLSKPNNFYLNINVDNGQYDVYFYVKEDYKDNSREFNVYVQDKLVTETPIGSLKLGEWAKYGPYEATVVDKNLYIDFIIVKGYPTVSGIELFSK
ncbi:F5/8 type C domain protein [compost metagenome]